MCNLNTVSVEVEHWWLSIQPEPPINLNTVSVEVEQNIKFLINQKFWDLNTVSVEVEPILITERQVEAT